MYVINDFWFLVVGLAAGLAAHRWVKGWKPETVADEAIGLLGALLGGYVAVNLFAPTTGSFHAASVGISLIGAVVALMIFHATLTLRHH